MAKFVSCHGKELCRDGEDSCLTCGRSHQEIIRLREVLDQIASLAIDFDYDNIDEYCEYIASKAGKSIRYRQSELNKAQSLV